MLIYVVLISLAINVIIARSYLQQRRSDYNEQAAVLNHLRGYLAQIDYRFAYAAQLAMSSSVQVQSLSYITNLYLTFGDFVYGTLLSKMPKRTCRLFSELAYATYHSARDVQPQLNIEMPEDEKIYRMKAMSLATKIACEEVTAVSIELYTLRRYFWASPSLETIQNQMTERIIARLKSAGVWDVLAEYAPRLHDIGLYNDIL